MAKVKLHLLNIFQLRLNKKFVEYDGKTVGEVISKFLNEYKNELDDEILDENRTEFNPQILILLNGRNIRYLKSYNTPINEGDDIYLSFALAGG